MANRRNLLYRIKRMILGAKDARLNRSPTDKECIQCKSIKKREGVCGLGSDRGGRISNDKRMSRFAQVGRQ